MDGFRSLSIALVVAVLLTGPLARVALAQQPQPPLLYEEAVKAAKPAAKEPGVVHQAGAVVANVVHIPGKVALCALGTGFGLVALAITLGSGYRTAARLAEEGCGGQWVVTAQDLAGERHEEPSRMY